MTHPAPESLTAALGNRYRVEGMIGAGGMAVVYRAHDRKHDRPVARSASRYRTTLLIHTSRLSSFVMTNARLRSLETVMMCDEIGRGVLPSRRGALPFFRR